MSLLEQHISPYVASQLPRLYAEEGPVFIQFIKAYYEWLEQDQGITTLSRSLPEYRDIDTTLDSFVSHFINKYMQGVPADANADPRLLQKHIKELYSSKGTPEGLKLLFQLLYNQTVNVYYPGKDILKPSDGVWIQQLYLEVSANPLNALLVGAQITGRESGATAIVEDFQIRYISLRQINILYLSNKLGNFKTGELLLNDFIADPLQSPTIIGSLSDIVINESGFNYSVGDVLDVAGDTGVDGKVVVSSTVSRNGAVSFNIIDGGSGYANDNAYAVNTIEVTPVSNTNPGIGATFLVGELSNTSIINTPVDIINGYTGVVLSASDYGFPAAEPTGSNINTPLDLALNYQNITIGTIETLIAINPGAGYNGPITVSVTNSIIAGLNIVDPVRLSIEGLNANISGLASVGVGAINSVSILDSGLGYSQGEDVTLSDATNTFIAGGVAQLGHQGKHAGYWLDSRSFLDADKYIQDDYYYQPYSYEVQASISFNRYSDLLKKIWHPAGFMNFGKVVIVNEQ